MMTLAVNEFLDEMRGGRMSDAPVVSVQQGALQGRLVSAADGKAYYSFQGIPYAKPPLGSLRFKAPQPVEPWEGVREATAEGNVSAQIDPLFHKEYIGDENCLFLNVYTPNLDGEFLPVMVFIHGGGFKWGSGNTSLYGPDYLVDRDVVVVTLNYRCGPLGFLCLNTPEVPGNAGLKDIVQAVKWVKDNIQNFGGNPGNVTVFGESAGGVAVSLLTASPLTKNLISKAIIQSGTGLNGWAFQKTPLENAKALAKTLGCESEDYEDILEFLSTTPVKDLVVANSKLAPPELFYEKASSIFAPVVEKEFPGVEAALTEPFIDLLTSGRTAEIPIMIGSTTLEFMLGHTPEDFQIFIPDNLSLKRNSEESLAVADKIKSLYFKDGHTGVEHLTEYYQLLSDKLINIDTHRYVKYLINVSKKPIYYYKFDYVGELNVHGKLLTSLGLKHASHMDELGYLFKNVLQNDVEPTAADVKMRERMLRLWTNFAKGGNPTPEENHFITVNWQPVTKDNLYYLKLGSELSLDTNPDKEKMEFWEELYSKYFKIWEEPIKNDIAIEQVTPVDETQETVDEKQETVDEKQETVDVKEENVETETVVHDSKSEPNANNVDEQEYVTNTNGIVTETEEVVQIVTKSEEIIETVTESENHEEVKPDIVESVTASETLVEEVKPEVVEEPEPIVEVSPLKEEVKIVAEEIQGPKVTEIAKEYQNGNAKIHQNGNGYLDKAPLRTSNEIKMAVKANGAPKDVIRANDPPEDDLPKNIGVNKFVNFFESLGGKK
ncbi:juvenile hormone esterase isoform X2 [Plutella xylostella]|uniref:juvenile hormone esterase isoform X2 n=1 Tax=Plutella xylostella TaxID=51655 RepID=UPI002032FF62|nr:juvenile hormone esterase isoform X2 [Plutella xylostella]